MPKYKGLITLEILEGADNYNKWITEKIMEDINSPVLEIGSGIGTISKYFICKKPLYLTDCDSGFVKYLKTKFKEKKEIFVEKFDLTKNAPVKFNSKFSSVIGINVLEHIKDDEQALRNIRNVLKEGGRLILLVPAKKFAYTRLDKNLGHYRRYEKEELINKITKTGYVVEKIFFFNVVGLLSWIIRDKIERENIHLKPNQIAVFDRIVPILKIIESYIRIPIGISIIVVAKKKQ